MRLGLLTNNVKEFGDAWRAIAHRPVIDLFELAQPWTGDLDNEITPITSLLNERVA